MSKETINIGAVVDDGSGDYARAGGIKINSNFDEIYKELGNEEVIYAAGSWKSFTPLDSTDNTLNIQFGEQYIIDASNTDIFVNLPLAVAPQDVGKSFKIRDASKTWGYNYGANSVTVQRLSTSTNTIKSSGSPVVLSEPYQDLEFVYTADNDWQYVDSKYIDRISNANRAVENAIEFLATNDINADGLYEWDLNATNDFSYNPSTVSVYRKGNLLSKGVDANGYPTINSDYGSVPSAENPSIIVTTAAGGDFDLGIAKLDGKTIKLATPANSGDTLIVKSLLENPDVYSSTYTSKSTIIQDINVVSEYPDDSLTVIDTKTNTTLTLSQFGMPPGSFFNPGSLKVSINGKMLIGEVFIGGTESPTNPTPWDYVVLRTNVDINNDGDIGDPTLGDGSDDSSELNKFYYNTIQFVDTGYLQHGDTVTLEWFNNNAGSALSWDGSGGIEELVGDKFLKTDEYLKVSNTMQYSDITNPSPQTALIDTSSTNLRVSTLGNLFNLWYPVGTIYENANNPNNPATYMGMGVWKAYSEGKVLTGYSNSADSTFHINPQLDIPAAGGEFGSEGVLIGTENIPPMSTDQQALVTSSALTSTIEINNGCLLNPDDSSETNYFSSERLTVNTTGGVTQQSISTIQPTITAYIWIRVA